MGLFDAIFGSRLGVELRVGNPMLRPGARVAVRATLRAPEDGPRRVKVARLHLRTTTFTFAPMQPTDPAWAQHQAQLALGVPLPLQRKEETRDLVAPMPMCEGLVIPQGQTWWRDVEVPVAAGLPPTQPGALEYSMSLWAIVEGQLIDTVDTVPVVMPALVAAVAAPTPDASAFAPGTACHATEQDGSVHAGMVVESRGAVTLVQWADGRAPTWVRSAGVRPV